MIARRRVHLSREEWEGGLLASCARATRTLGRCSPGRGARLGALGVGRVKRLRAVVQSVYDHLPKGLWKLAHAFLATCHPLRVSSVPIRRVSI